MTAAARLAIGFFSVFAVQRWICAGALVLMLADIAIVLTSGRLTGILFLLGFVMLAICSMATTALVFRGQSAIRAHHLAPAFRAKMLTGLVMHLLLILLAWNVWLALWPQAAALARDARTILIYPAFFLTWAHLGIIVAARAPADFLTVLVPSLLAGFWIANGGPQQLSAAGVDPAPIAAALTVTAWAVFSGWYLRTRRITFGFPATPDWQIGQKSIPDSWLPGERRAAASAMIAPQFLTPFGRTLRQLIVAWLVLHAVHWFLSTYLGRRPFDGQIVQHMNMIFPLMIASATNQIARRTRYIWLRFGSSRAQLFELAESRALVIASVMFGFLVAFILTLPVFDESVTAARIFGFTGIVITNGLLGTYAGLMYVSGFRTMEIAACAVFVIGYFVSTGWIVSGSEHWWILVLIALQVAMAATCRREAMRRWRDIDWIRLKSLAWLDGQYGSGQRR